MGVYICLHLSYKSITSKLRAPKYVTQPVLSTGKTQRISWAMPGHKSIPVSHIAMADTETQRIIKIGKAL